MAWFLAGGFPMVFVLVFGLSLVGGAARFAWAPGDGAPAGLGVLGVSVLLMGVAGSLVDLTVVARFAPEHPAWAEDAAAVALAGLGEALAPSILAAGLASAAALLVALGHRRAGGV